MNEAMKAELIRFARRHKYDRSEGFADEPMSVTVPPEIRGLADVVAADLAQAAGVSLEVAESAFLCWTVEQVIAAHEEGKLDDGFSGYLEQKFGCGE